MYVIEYQKRGLPQAHILLMLANQDRLRNSSDIDKLISAEIPPPAPFFTEEDKQRQAEKLQSIVLRCMIHGPCGPLNRRSPCMVDGKCSKYYPKDFAARIFWDEQANYPSYKRLSPADGGHTAVVGQFSVDNRWVVPYSPYLLLKFDAHINVEACISQNSPKYIFMYINKVKRFFLVHLNQLEGLLFR